MEICCNKHIPLCNLSKYCLLITIMQYGIIKTSSFHLVEESISSSYAGYIDSNLTTYEINIIWTIPFNNSYIFSKDRTEPAIYQGLKDSGAVLCDEFYSREPGTEFPKNTCFNIIVNDTRCDADYAMNRAVDIQDILTFDSQCALEEERRNIESMNVFIGMSCDWTAGRVGALASNWEWPAIFPGARSWGLDNKNLGCCGTLTRTGHTATDIGNFVLRVYDEYLWNTSYIIYSGYTPHGAPIHDDTRSDCSTIVAGIGESFKVRGWKTYEDFSYISKLDDEYLLNDTEAILEEIKNNARVSIWCIGRKAMRYVMNRAHAKGMTGGDFAFLYLDFYNTNTSYEWTNEDDQDCELTREWVVEYNENFTYCDKDVGNSTDGMRALQVITLHQPETKKFEDFSNLMKSSMGPGVEEKGEFVNPFVTQYYNSVLLLVNGLNKSLGENFTDLSDGRYFARQLWNTSFESVDGFVKIAETGDRVMDYTLMDMNKDTGLFQVASVYFGVNQSLIQVEPIDWPGDVVPLNVPICGSYTPCVNEGLSTTIKVLIGLAVFLLICLLVTLFIAQRRLHHEKMVRKRLWKVDLKDVDFFINGERRFSQSTLSHSVGSEIAPFRSSLNGRQIFTDRARWKDRVVAMKKLTHLQRVNVNRDLILELEEMLTLENEHICKFYGACVDDPVFILSEYCSRGSLQDFLEGETGSAEFDDVFCNFLIMDIAHGMQFLHRSSIHSHGNLKSSNCLVDSRFVVKITDFGLPSLRYKEKRDSVVGYNHYKDLLWTAPELLRMDDPPATGTQKGDIYSFAIVVQEIIFRKGVFYLGEDELQTLTPNSICERVMCPYEHEEPFRPTLVDNDDVIIDTKLRLMISECWDENAELRPTFTHILNFMRKATKYRKQNVVDSLLSRLEKYSNNLEVLVMERTELYKAEKERADTLLYQMLPKSVAERLKRGQDVQREKFDCVTIYFSDIVGFTAISHDSNPSQVVKMLDDLYTMFDQILDKFRVYKVETIGDAYMVASGLPERIGKEHVREIARMSLDLIDGVEQFEIPHMPGRKMNLRVGIHSGPVVAGVVGQKMPRYCLFGDTVNTAARMEQNGEALRIHMSPSTKELLDEFGTFIFEKRDTEVYMKGLGDVQTWWLEGEVREYDGTKVTHKVSVRKEDQLEIGLSPKRISDSSGFSSARTSIEESAIRISVTGVEEEYDSAHDDSLNNPNIVPCDEQYKPSTIKTPDASSYYGSQIMLNRHFDDTDSRPVTSQSNRKVKFEIESEGPSSTRSSPDLSTNRPRYHSKSSNKAFEREECSDSVNSTEQITSM